MDWSPHKDGSIPTNMKNELRILSIDGGGMKGIIPAVYLKRVEQYIGRPIHEFFDLITGTSTGGIIALGLAKGLSADDISKLYIEKGDNIFSKNVTSNMLLSSKYSNRNLSKILKENFGETRMDEAKTMLCIPSIEHHKAQPKVYKTPHHKDYILDGERYLWEVALATSAAPTYFPAASIGEGECKIDGGLWANNPVLVAIAEGKKLGFGLDQMRVLSLGTGDSIYHADNKIAEKSGLLSWKSNLVELTFQVQSKSATYTAAYLLGDQMCRVSPTFGRPLKLDTTAKEDVAFMISEANHLYENTFIKNNIYTHFFNPLASVVPVATEN